MSTEQGSFFKRLARAVFGELEWSAPRWSAGVSRKTRSALRAGFAFAKQNPRPAAIGTAAVVLALVGSYAAWHWYQAQPKPVETQFAVSALEPTCYSCTPPGKPQPLLVHFNRSAAPLKLTGKDLDPGAGTIGMTPALHGVWHWDDDRTVRFLPAEDWPVGATVRVKFAHRDFVPAHIRLEKYDFDFLTPEFGARIAATQFNQDPVVANDKKVVVTVTFTHPIDPERFEKRISLTLFERLTDTIEQKRGTTPFTVVYDKLHLNAYIHSALLAVPNKPGRLAIRIDPGVRAARGGNQTQSPMESSVDVPGLYSLQVQEMQLSVANNDRDEPNQVLVVTMNHSVLERDMAPSVHAWRLPMTHPDPRIQARFAPPGNAPFPWSNSTVNPDILAAAKSLPLTQIPGELEHYGLHSFRHGAEPGDYIFVKVDKGLKSFGGYVLVSSVEQVFRVPDYPRELRIAQAGSLLSLSGDKSLNVMTRDVQALRVEIGRVLPQQIQHLVTQTRGKFGAPTFENWNFDTADLTERFTTTVRLPALKPGTPHYESIPLGTYLAAGRGIFFVTVHALTLEEAARPPSDERDWNDARRQPFSDGRLVVLTDMGLLGKKSVDGSQDIFVQSIGTGLPLAAVQVDILGRNGQTVLSQTTDGDGHVHFPDLRSFKRERQPVLFIARRGGDSSFLPVEDRDRRLDLSRFDVGGVDNRIDRSALAAYLFSDRGLYRPGEEIHLGAIVRAQDWKSRMQGVPLRLDIVDPRGITVRSEPFSPGPGGFSEIVHKTRVSSPAGTYTVSLSIVRPQQGLDLIGSTVVQVRDFLPDRLRMSTRFSAESANGWVTPENLNALVSLQNLFGTPAANRRVTARMTLSPAIASFKAFPDYHFYDPQTASQGFDEPLNATVTSATGAATFDLNLQRFARATYRLQVAAEGFEADGGRGVSAEAAQLVSNMPYLVGWKSDGGLEYVSRDLKRSVHLIAIGPDERRIDAAGIRIARLEVRYVSALIRQNSGVFQYESRRKEVVLNERDATLPAAGFDLALETATPGSYAYVVRDAGGLQLARIDYRVAGDANLTRTLEKDAQLQIALARPDYAPGDEIEMQIQAPYTGSGLITIERDRVYAWHWFQTSTTSSLQHIRLPPGIEGNAYVHVAFVRDPASAEVYTSPLSYGVQPFSINLDSRRNPIHLEVPATARPGEAIQLNYSTQRPARIAIFAVDEGVLQVARYRTPDPLGHFFQKRSLGVATTQILDLILPEFREGSAAAATGGDRESTSGRHLNPFRRKGDKPVAYWSGIVDADSAPRSLSYVVPDYFNGTLRVIAVAVTDEAVGVQEGETVVRGDFVLSPNAPTTVTPGDEFDVSVGVANNLQGSGNAAQVSVTVEPGPALRVLGAATQILAIPENHETSARFRVQTLDKLGPVDLVFTAGTGRTAARRQIDISVRPATPYMTALEAGLLKPGSKDVRIARDMYPEHRKLSASASLVPLTMAHGLVTYLGSYPYACTEQLVSQAMPALLLADRPEFGYVRAQPGADIEGLINELRVRQNDEGAYRLWPGGNYVAEFVSLYAQHFLIEAGARGERVPAGLVDSGNAYLRALATRDGNNLAAERDSAYAIYLLARQGQVVSAEAAALRKRLGERYKDQWHQDLAAAWLAAAFKLMQQDNDAAAAAAPLRFGVGVASDVDTYADDMTRDGFLLYLFARHFPERLRRLPPEVLENLASRINANQYHSLSAGTTLLGLDAYIKATHADSAPQLAIGEVLKGTRSLRPLDVPAELIPNVPFTPEAAALRFSNGSGFNGFYLVDQSGFDRTPPREAITKGFEILREYTDANGRPLARITMGEQADVHLKFRALEDHAIAEVALVDLLPGGFDLVIPPQDSDANVTTNYRFGWHCQFCINQAGDTLTYADPREDRIVFYGTVTHDVQEIVYRIKATNVGSYVIPPAYGEAMYDRNVLARSVAGRIEVTRP